MTVSWVRIPLSPPKQMINPTTVGFFVSQDLSQARLSEKDRETKNTGASLLFIICFEASPTRDGCGPSAGKARRSQSHQGGRRSGSHQGWLRPECGESATQPIPPRGEAKWIPPGMAAA